MIRLVAISNKAPQATTFLLAEGAFDLVTSFYTFSEVFEFVFLIQEYFGSPQRAKFMHICIACASKLFQLDRPIHRSALNSKLLTITGAPAESANLILRHNWVYFVVRSLLQDLEVVSDDLTIRVELNLIFSLSNFLARFA